GRPLLCACEGSVPGGGEAGRGDRESVLPRSRPEDSVLIPHQRRPQPVRLGRVAERPPALVAVPLLVHQRLVAREAAQHGAAPGVRALVAPGGAVLADARRGYQVERAGLEAVLRAGERTDRAHLHGVAREVGVERLAGRGPDVLARPALQELDEVVARDLLGGPHAAGAGDAPLPVEQHLGRDRDGLVELPLVLAEPGPALAV